VAIAEIAVVSYAQVLYNKKNKATKKEMENERCYIYLTLYYTKKNVIIQIVYDLANIVDVALVRLFV